MNLEDHMHLIKVPDGISTVSNRWYLFFFRDGDCIGKVSLEEHDIYLEGFENESEDIKEFAYEYSARYMKIGPYINIELADDNSQNTSSYSSNKMYGYLSYDSEDSPITFYGFGKNKEDMFKSFEKDIDKTIKNLLILRNQSDKLKKQYGID